MWFGRKKQPIVVPEVKPAPPDPVVLDIKLKSKQAAQEAQASAQKLNKVFEANGITLAIHIAAGGK